MGVRTCQDLERDQAEGVHVRRRVGAYDSLVVLRRDADLWRRVAKGDHTAQRNRIAGKRRGAKVDQLPAGIRRKPHDVLWIQLTVDDLSFMQLPDHQRDLNHSHAL